MSPESSRISGKEKENLSRNCSMSCIALSDSGTLSSAGSKKNCTLSHEERKELIVHNHADISISRQAELLGISRSSIYCAPLPDPEEIKITGAIDELFTKYPFYGSRRMRGALADDYGICIGRHQTRRLMRLMGLEAIYPREKPKTSISEPSHRKYPYLLRGLPIIRPNH